MIPGLASREFSADVVLFDFAPTWTRLFVVVNVTEQTLAGSAIKYLGAQRLVAIRDLIVMFFSTVIVLLFTSMVGGLLGIYAFGGDYFDARRAWYFGGVTAMVIVAPYFLTVKWPARVNRKFIINSGLMTRVLAAMVAWELNPMSPVMPLLGAFIAPILG